MTTKLNTPSTPALATKDFKTELTSFKESLDSYLTLFLDGKINAASKIDQRYEKFWQSIREVVLAGGKRIRPFLVAVGFGEVDSKIIPVAATQEIMHSAFLMLDDVIDQDTTRHGVKNINGIYKEEYSNHIDPFLSTHFSNSIGILAGGLLISESYNHLNKTSFSGDIVVALQDQLYKAYFESVAGEILDVEATIFKDLKFDPINIYCYKTASYSFVCPLVSGAICAGVDKDETTKLKMFAELLGVGYQIQDDIIGVFGEEEKSGKSNVSDLREGKQTLLISLHKKLANQEQTQSLQFFGQTESTDSNLNTLKQDILNSGAKEQTAKLKDEYFKKAEAILDDLQAGYRKSMLKDLLIMIKSREA